MFIFPPLSFASTDFYKSFCNKTGIRNIRLVSTLEIKVTSMHRKGNWSENKIWTNLLCEIHGTFELWTRWIGENTACCSSGSFKVSFTFFLSGGAHSFPKTMFFCKTANSHVKREVFSQRNKDSCGTVPDIVNAHNPEPILVRTQLYVKFYLLKAIDNQLDMIYWHRFQTFP